MKRREDNSRIELLKILTIIAVFAAIVGFCIYVPYGNSKAASNNPAPKISGLYNRIVPNLDLNKARALDNLRPATGAQAAALNGLKTSANAPRMTSRWNDFSGSPDVIYDFASQSFSGSPEEAGRAFLQQNAELFGISDINNLRLVSNKQALGGYLLRFQQTFNGIDVIDGGIGLVLNRNKQVVMASGPHFRNVTVDTQPSVSAAQAKQTAGFDLSRFEINLPANINNLMQNGLSKVTQQMSAVSNLEPKLGIYPTADGFRLVWKVATVSTNPFGLFLTQIDAHTGEVVSRKDFINFQTQGVLPYTADIYPKYPTITQELKDQSIIKNCTVDGVTAPCGQERVTLRAFDQQNIITGLNGTLTGTHALVNNALPTKQPFVQAGRGTWHFRQDNPTNFEARTNEQDQFSEPAEHQDEINAFFFVTYLLEYVDYLHVAGDTGGFGEGAFPNTYPNKTIPLPATVHIPNAYLALNVVLDGRTPDPADPDLVYKALGMDNAFAANVTGIYQIATGMVAPEGVVNPTSYGHGFFLNDLALEGTVPYHEGMHAITSPIAGLEGGPEASAMNEGQADMWAFTITDNPSLGDYVVNAKGYRDRARSRGQNPDSIQYIRSARSTLKYSDIGTLFFPASTLLLIDEQPDRYDFEEHYDGEIYMSTMWDVREMLNRVYPQVSYKRPRPRDGQALKPVTKGTEIFERDFLGAMYVLGTTAPDTMVKSRDALIVADQMLYPSDASEPSAPGKHRAMIEQIFAAKELGINAREVDAGNKATISTQVTPFAGDQTAPAVPTNIQVNSSGARALNISWNAVPGAVSYEVLKRKRGFENQRQPNGKREFLDGDASTTGFRHVAFVDGNQSSYTDEGAVHEVYAPEGLDDLFSHEYVVRAIGVNSSGQLGFSNLSGASQAIKARQDLTDQIDSAMSNYSFTGGVTAFDTKLTNARGAFSVDRIMYGALQFQITNISSPSVTVKNADQSGNTFVYNETLPLGAVSKAKRFEFNNPNTQLFTFDARIYGNAFFSSTVGTGSQSPDGTAEPPAPVVYSVFTETKTGTLLAGEPSNFVTGSPSPTYGDPTFKGVTWDDIEVTTKSDAQFIDATLSADTLARDIDFELRTVDGQVIATGATDTANEHFIAAVQPNTRYIFRVKGWANGPVQYRIVSDQLLPNGSPNENGGKRTIGGNGTSTSGSGGPVSLLTRVIRFTVNPLTRTVSARIIR
jgi:Zn-dependent metalloprotease